MLKKLVIAFILYCNISYAENPLNKYSLTLEDIPVACGHRLTVEQYLKDYKFELQNISLGRSKQNPKGEPVFYIEYYINKNTKETVVILGDPHDLSMACIGFRTFDLKSGGDIKKYLMMKNRK